MTTAEQDPSVPYRVFGTNHNGIRSTILVTSISGCYKRDAHRIAAACSKSKAAARLDLTIFINNPTGRIIKADGLRSWCDGSRDNHDNCILSGSPASLKLSGPGSGRNTAIYRPKRSTMFG